MHARTDTDRHRQTHRQTDRQTPTHTHNDFMEKLDLFDRASFCVRVFNAWSQMPTVKGLAQIQQLTHSDINLSL